MRKQFRHLIRVTRCFVASIFALYGSTMPFFGSVKQRVCA